MTITLEALDEDDSKTQDNWSKAQTGSGTVSASDDSDPSYGPGSSGTEDDWEEDAWEDEDSEDADWQSSGMSGSESRTYRGAWLYDGVGWWYCYAEGGYPVNGWLLIDDCWYYFDGAVIWPQAGFSGMDSGISARRTEICWLTPSRPTDIMSGRTAHGKRETPAKKALENGISSSAVYTS